jgi:hypothetical protein
MTNAPIQALDPEIAIDAPAHESRRSGGKDEKPRSTPWIQIKASKNSGPDHAHGPSVLLPQTDGAAGDLRCALGDRSTEEERL